MESTRRTFLLQGSGAVGLLLLDLLTPELIAQARRHAADSAATTKAPKFRFLTQQEGADFEAFAAQILPTDDSPGAREAGAVYFADYVLSSINPEQQQDFRNALALLRVAASEAQPRVSSFASLASEQQIAVMKAMEKPLATTSDTGKDSPLGTVSEAAKRAQAFGMLRFVVLAGTFCDPSLQGNRFKIGWKLIGFDDQAYWGPPVWLLRCESRGEGMSTAPHPLKRYALNDAVDFVIVGCGASGGVLARELSQSGFSVVVLEQGPWKSAKEFGHNEYLNWSNSELMNDWRKQPNTFRKTPQDKAHKQPCIMYGRLVGGGPVHFTANYWRFHEIDFVEASKKGTIPGTGFADWPITYADLEPYYTKAEWALGISGQAGVSPFDPPRSKPYPLPPMPVKPDGILFEKGARKLGYHPYPAPVAVISKAYDGRMACQHCGWCEGFGCEHGAKSSPLPSMVPQAVATGRCEIRPHSYVRKVEIDEKGRAIGVIYFDEKKLEKRQRARAVILAANGAETPRLLLMSKSNRFPDGLANSSGLVGKYLMFNTDPMCGGLFEHELNGYKSIEVTRILQDFYEIDPKLGFYGGGGISARFQNFPISFALGGLPPSIPQWGSEFKKALTRYFTRSMVLMGHGSSLPVETNSISLDDTVKDDWGLPAIRVTYKDHPDDLKVAAFLQDRSMEILEAAGAQDRWRYPVGESNFGVHLLGTCRMGSDPKTSVVNADHRTHDVPNLFLCDGSSFVTSGRGQPTAHIQGLAFRAADRITVLAKKNEI